MALRTTKYTGSLHRNQLKRICNQLKLIAFGLGLIVLLALTATPIYLFFTTPLKLPVSMWVRALRSHPLIVDANGRRESDSMHLERDRRIDPHSLHAVVPT